MDQSLYIARIGSGFLQQKWNDSSRHFRSGGILVELYDKYKTHMFPCGSFDRFYALSAVSVPAFNFYPAIVDAFLKEVLHGAAGTS